MSGLEKMEGLIGAALEPLGVEHFEVLMRLFDEWETLAPDPWRDNAKPVVLRSHELIVEARSASVVGLLRYATGALLRSLDEQLGEDIVASVRVRAPRP